MTIFFNRKVRAVIGKRGGPGIEITTRISFDIQKTPLPLANKGNLTFYNLSSETRDFLEQDDLYCELYAGHEANQSLIFVGSVGYINPDLKSPDLTSSSRSGQDIITKIECRDADLVYRSSVSVRAQKGESKRTVIEQVIASLGIAKGSIAGLPEDTFARGFTFEGLAPDFLTQTLNPYNADWSIQDEILQVKPMTEPVDQNAIVLEPETGLFDDLQKRSQKSRGRVSIIELQGSCLLNPLMKPAKLIRVKSSRFSKNRTIEDLGLWIVQEVQHVGDSFGGEYKTAFKAKKYA